MKRIGLILALFAVVLSFVDLALAVVAMVHHAKEFGSPKSSYGTMSQKLEGIAVLALLGVLCPIAAATFLLWDWTRTGLSTVRRLYLVGWFVIPQAVVVLILIETFPRRL